MKFSPKVIISVIITLILIPAVILTGSIFGGTNYYFSAVVILLMAFIPILMHFEGRALRARELVVLASMTAIAVAGRAAFFMTPQFKPVCAVVIVAGVCFGAQNGFIVGMITALVSNFFFSQGIWTPFQMFALGLVGFFAGLIFFEKKYRKNRAILCVYGALSTFFIYGFIADISTVLALGNGFSWESAAVVYTSALPFNAIHAASTVIFLLIIGRAMIEKADRVRVKYGIFEKESADKHLN